MESKKVHEVNFRHLTHFLTEKSHHKSFGYHLTKGRIKAKLSYTIIQKAVAPAS